MKFRTKKKAKETTITMQEEGDETVCIFVDDESVLYFNDLDNGTLHIYKDKLKELGIKIYIHRGCN